MQESWWGIIISGILGFVMWGAQVSPKQAISNTAEWAIFFGLKQPPIWLKSPSADRLVFHIAAALFTVFAGLELFAFFGGSKMQLGPKILIMVGCASLVLSIGWNLIAPSSADTAVPAPKGTIMADPDKEKAAQVTQNVTSYNQTGGITAGTVNIGAARAVFNDQLKSEILQKVPKGKVQLQTIGGNADQAIGNEVQVFLLQNGYSVDRSAIGMQVPAPDHPFSLSINDGQAVLTVAPSAR